jgi:hypothetical protein
MPEKTTRSGVGEAHGWRSEKASGTLHMGVAQAPVCNR